MHGMICERKGCYRYCLAVKLTHAVLIYTAGHDCCTRGFHWHSTQMNKESTDCSTHANMKTMMEHAARDISTMQEGKTRVVQLLHEDARCATVISRPIDDDYRLPWFLKCWLCEYLRAVPSAVGISEFHANLSKTSCVIMSAQLPCVLLKRCRRARHVGKIILPTTAQNVNDSKPDTGIYLLIGRYAGERVPVQAVQVNSRP